MNIEMIRGLIVLLMVCVVCSSAVYAQQLTTLQTIKLSQTELLKAKGVITTEFLTKKKKSIGQFDAINVHDIVAAYLEKIAESIRRRVVFIAESEDGTKQTFTLADIRPDISPLPAILLLRRTITITNDTLRLTDTGNLRSALDHALGGVIVKRLHLPFQDITQDISNAFQPMSIIFPLDGKPIRTLSNVRTLYICHIENK